MAATTPAISGALISAAAQGSGSGSSSVSRRRLDVVSFTIEIAPPSHNAHLMGISNVIWEEAFTYLSFKELCFGVVRACKYLRQRSAQALMPIFKRSAYGSANFIGRGGEHHFWRFPAAFKTLRGEELSSDQLIAHYWANKKSLFLDSFSHFDPGWGLTDSRHADFEAMHAHGPTLESLIVHKVHEYPSVNEITALVLASPNLTECSLFRTGPTAGLLEAVASRRSLRSFEFFETADSRFAQYFELNAQRNADFLPRYEAAILKLLSSHAFESFQHNGWQLTVPVLKAIASYQEQIKDLALGHSGNSYDRVELPVSAPFADLDFALLEDELITTLKATGQLRALMLRQDWTSHANPIEPAVRKYFVTDKTLETLAENCSDLRKLELFNCSNITTAGITLLAMGCCNLETLFLVQEWFVPSHQPFSYNAVDDAALSALSFCCSELKEIAISSRSITDKGVAHLMTCPKLEGLNLDGCRGVTPRCLEALRSFLRPNLDCINLQNTFVNTAQVAKDIDILLRELLPRLPARFKLGLDVGIHCIERKSKQNRLAFKPW